MRREEVEAIIVREVQDYELLLRTRMRQCGALFLQGPRRGNRCEEWFLVKSKGQHQQYCGYPCAQRARAQESRAYVPMREVGQG